MPAKKNDIPVAKTTDKRLIAARKAFLKAGGLSLTIRQRVVLGREVDLDHRLFEAIAAYEQVAAKAAEKAAAKAAS